MEPTELKETADDIIIRLCAGGFSMAEAAAILYWALHKITARSVGEHDAEAGVRTVIYAMTDTVDGESMTDMLVASDKDGADAFEDRISTAASAGAVARYRVGLLCDCDTCTADRAARAASD
jgi:hypothetical protein